MLPDRVTNPGPLTYESGALPIALRGPAQVSLKANDLFFFRQMILIIDIYKIERQQYFIQKVSQTAIYRTIFLSAVY